MNGWSDEISNVEGDRVESLIVAALIDKESLVGVVEAVNRLDGSAFRRRRSIRPHQLEWLRRDRTPQRELAPGRTESGSARNSRTREPGDYLDPQPGTRSADHRQRAPGSHPVRARRHRPGTERASYKLAAVTGLTQVDPDAPDIAPLNDVLRWVMLSAETVNVRQHGEEMDAPGRNARQVSTVF